MTDNKKTKEGIEIPVKYFSRVVEFNIAKESHLVLTRISYVRHVANNLLTAPCLFLWLFTIAMSMPLLFTKSVWIYYSIVFIGLFLSYQLSGFYNNLTTNLTFMDRIARKLGYNSRTSKLFDFDKEMFEAITANNSLNIQGDTFDDLYRLIFLYKKKRNLVLIK